MPERVKVEVEGAAQLAAALKALPKKMGDKTLASAVRAAAVVVQKEAKERAPFLSGLLISKIKVKKDKTGPGSARYFVMVDAPRKLSLKKKSKLKAAGVSVRQAVPYYWPMVEGLYRFKKRNYQATPFLRPAFEAKRLEALAKIQAVLKKKLTTVNAGYRGNPRYSQRSAQL